MKISLLQKKAIVGHLASAATVVGVVLGAMLLAFPREELKPAFAASRQAREAGAGIFHEKGCQHCHGVDATGTDRGPDLSTIGKRWHKDRIEQQIRLGGGAMPAFGDILQPDEITSLVEYLSAKRKPVRNRARSAPGKPAAPETPASAKPSVDDSGQ